MSSVRDAREAIAAVVAGQFPRDLESSTLDFKTVGRSRNDTLEDLAEAMACASGRSSSVSLRERPTVLKSRVELSRSRGNWPATTAAMASRASLTDDMDSPPYLIVPCTQA